MTDDIEEALAVVARKHAQVEEVREKIKAEVEARWADELAALRWAESLYAIRARAQGASLSRIGRAMGTTDWRTIKERLALAGEKEEQ